jgi:hypothetical protein
MCWKYVTWPFGSDELKSSLGPQLHLVNNTLEKNLGACLQREIQNLSESCEDVEKKRQKLAQELQIKDNKLSIVEGQLSHAKAQLDTETHKVCINIVISIEQCIRLYTTYMYKDKHKE